MAKHLFLIHGRSFKPSRRNLRSLWLNALQHGVERDFGGEVAKKYKSIRKSFIYFGDLSNNFLKEDGQKYKALEDLKSRKDTLQALKAMQRKEFIGNTGKRNYSNLEGKNSLKEALADFFSFPFDFFRLSEHLITAVAPDMSEYWNPDSEFGSNLRKTLTNPLATALGKKEDIMLIGHSLGTIISYDCLWKFSHYGEYQRISDRKISTFISLGSPLGNETIRRNLKGSRAKGPRKYPQNILRWENVAAEDDYICHDENLANDFRNMRGWGLVRSINDHRIYNLAVRKGKSNPHHGVGYLIHPTVSRLVADWVKR